eukprot:m.149076 g.149076  ORF g.149076 m.149076 type:complete len:195 (-) comp14201_c0_seq7:2189-2773(-)
MHVLFVYSQSYNNFVRVDSSWQRIHVPELLLWCCLCLLYNHERHCDPLFVLYDVKELGGWGHTSCSAVILPPLPSSRYGPYLIVIGGKLLTLHLRAVVVHCCVIPGLYCFVSCRKTNISGCYHCAANTTALRCERRIISALGPLLFVLKRCWYLPIIKFYQALVSVPTVSVSVRSTGAPLTPVSLVPLVPQRLL